VFGAATSAYQVEGGAALGGRTPSIWDVFAAVPGAIADGSSGGVAVDHYHRWAADLKLLADLGATGYRMSLSWPRLQPRGGGPVNPDGIAFYDRLIDGLLESGIAPFVSLHHRDMPLEVMERGGWLIRETTDAFAEYAALAADAFGDRVAAWATVDEPLLEMAYGYAVGIDAPGLTLLGGAFRATHHQLLAHGRAAAALRSASAAPIGIVNRHTTVDPARRSGADRVAASFFDLYHNRQFADPILLGHYPAAILDMPDAGTEVIRDGDLALISAPLDYYGISHAHPTVVAAAPGNTAIAFSLEPGTGMPMGPAGWPVHPESLTRLLLEMDRRYPTLPPVYVTGTGGAFDDESAAAGTAPDLHRIAYLDGHLAAIAAAINTGCDVRGYFHWSLLDSWEWAEGFTRRFGLVRVDPGSLERTPRASFAHYRDLITATSARRSRQPPDRC
jgi:beta-glucosidase